MAGGVPTLGSHSKIVFNVLVNFGEEKVQVITWHGDREHLSVTRTDQNGNFYSKTQSSPQSWRTNSRIIKRPLHTDCCRIHKEYVHISGGR